MGAHYQSTVDTRGRPLGEGDRVQRTRDGFERGYVTRAVGGPIISVRLDATGRTLTSTAKLWMKIDP
jgi:hypothetical protein